jgi:hypothetical protein
VPGCYVEHEEVKEGEGEIGSTGRSERQARVPTLRDREETEEKEVGAKNS